ncbi:hypothetical protein [Mesorhizobium sp. M0643]|uniref:hypothetical protein n=1 Tax=Mesorhizobium sp. M0643 TaxID=2956978 RepID=UPI00333626F4
MAEMVRMMKVWGSVFPMLSCGPGATAARAGEKPANVKALLKAYGELNDLCRGGSGDEASTNQACEDREAVGERLAAANWCYGKSGQAGYQMKWHRCAANSLRPGN